MADELKTILIKDLQEAESASDTDYIAIDNGTVTKKIRVDNYNKTANGTAKSYAESAKESADKAQRNADSISSTISEITNNITAAQSAAIQAEKSAEAAESATLNLQTYVNSAKESADNAKVSEESAKNVADKIADSNKIAQSYAVGGTDYRTGEDTDNARYYYSGAKTAEANSETYKTNAAASESAAATSEINAKTSETNAAKSAASASSSAESATASKTAAATSEQNASNSADYARTNATRAESYAIGGTSSRSGEDTDNAKYYAQQAKKSAELAAGSITGVSSFNNRTGTIMPENGDYKAEQITYDNSASGVSANTVQSAIDKVAESDALKANKADVSSLLSGKQDNLGIKSIGSNLTLSGGVLDAKKQLTVDTALSTTSANPVQNKAVAAAINANISKIDALTEKINAVSMDAVKLSSSNSTSDSIKFGIDSNGRYGYIKAGADAVTPFRLGNAKAENVLAGKTFSNEDASGIEGTMPDRGVYQFAGGTGNGNGYYTLNRIPAGYYHAEGNDASWGPEIRISAEDAKNSQMWKDAYNSGLANKALHRVVIGTGGNGTYSAASIPNFQNLTLDNFAFNPTNLRRTDRHWGDPNTYSRGKSVDSSTNCSMSYDANNGILTVSGLEYSNEIGESKGKAIVTGQILCFYA